MNDFDERSSAIDDLTGDYAFDPAHTRIGFVARHAMVTKVRGTFTQFEGSFHLDAADPTRSSVQLAIQADSIDTGQEQRDAHLRTNDFLDVPNHPQLVFQSKEIKPVDEDVYSVTGDLTIKGVTRPVTLEVEFTGSAKDPFGNMRAGFEGRTTINRTEWGVNWNAALETGGFLVSEKVVLEIDVSGIKQADSAG
ncbi:polyisoprenoid-binding protein YceI [Motilibacter peucedani]|uniref:Polyisoprenoid-binding protein YceI n=1 Tax=Motilibacter peucedani TaxID=598650 RepID=A0A420XUS0_9ACTN|nr:YceI family protein [Motilibacter peucedani]RKS80481.1 polyisoprenoid-binding protein YceI [Motilibacter peucedani]